MDRNRNLNQILIWTLLLGLLLPGCSSPQTESNPPETKISTPEPASGETDKLRLRIEFSVTSEWGDLVITGMENVLKMQIVEAIGSEYESAGPDFMTLGRLAGEQEASMVVEVALSPVEDQILTFTSKHSAGGGSFTRIYWLPDAGEPLLLTQFDHDWADSNSLERNSTPFGLDLSSLSSTPIPSITPVVNRAEISCGQTIVTDTTLVEDLACYTDSAIIVGAPNITLDLGGHVISGYAGAEGVVAENTQGITIRNGTIKDFGIGVVLVNTRDVTLEDLTIRNLTISDPEHFIFGTAMTNSQDIVVRDSFFEFLPVYHKQAVEIYSSDVAIINIEQHGGGVGVDFSFAGDCDPEHTPSNGSVLNSRFFGVTIAGILVQCSDSARIADNVFTQNEVGIMSDPPFYGAVSGLTIEGNNFHDGYIGILGYGIIESSISNNVFTDNDHWGIAIQSSRGCHTGDPGYECFYATANVIEDNETSGNFIDLFEHEDCEGNSWVGNSCETKEGADIPECTR